MARKLRVAVLYGGRSAEHDVSLQSARNILAAIHPKKYEVLPILITKEGRWRAGVLPPGSLPNRLLAGIPEKGVEVIPVAHPGNSAWLVPATPNDLRNAALSDHIRLLGRPDVIFPVLHGTFGEDGTVQGLLELSGIAYVGAGVLGSAAGMDKDVMKRLFRERGLPIVPYLTVHRSEIRARVQSLCQAVERALRYPVFVKPANLGSSVGVSKAVNRRELERGVRSAAEFDTKVLIEKGIEGREIECAVLGNEQPVASLPGEVVPAGDFYDYSAKYLEDTAQLLMPAPLRPAQVKRVQHLAVEAFRAVECAGMGRVDLFLERTTGRFYVNEINTIPGFTRISMYPRLWEASGVAYPQLLDRLIELARERHRERARTQYCRLPAAKH